MSYNSKKTSISIARLASQILRDKEASNIQKSLAGGALSQRAPTKQTGAKMEDIASDVLSSSKYNSVTKKLAASILAQANKER